MRERLMRTACALVSRSVAPCLALCVALWIAAASSGAADAQRAVRASTHRALSEIRVAMEARRFEDAMAQIAALAPRVRGEPFERALLEETRAYALLEQERYDEAIPALEAALAENQLPDAAVANLHYNLAQLQLMAGRAADAAGTLEALLAAQPAATTAAARALVGHAYYMLERYPEARRELERAVAADAQPSEAWLQLLLAICWEQQAFDRARDVLRDLVARFPEERRYWVDLSAISMQLEDEPLAVASLELAEDAGLLEGEDLLRLVRLNLHLDAPARAGRLLEDALAAGRVETSAERLELLADAWVMAREYERAIDALRRAREMVPERRAALALREGELLVHLERWSEAIVALAGATESESEDVAAQANLLLGVAAYYRGDYAQSLVAFGRAEASETTRSQARQWVERTLFRVAPGRS